MVCIPRTKDYSRNRYDHVFDTSVNELYNLFFYESIDGYNMRYIIKAQDYFSTKAQAYRPDDKTLYI